MDGMNQPRPVANTVALVVTVLYGAIVALLAILGVEAMSVVAVVGAILVGAMWAVIGVTGRRSRA